METLELQIYLKNKLERLSKYFPFPPPSNDNAAFSGSLVAWPCTKVENFGQVLYTHPEYYLGSDQRKWDWGSGGRTGRPLTERLAVQVSLHSSLSFLLFLEALTLNCSQWSKTAPHIGRNHPLGQQRVCEWVNERLLQRALGVPQWYYKAVTLVQSMNNL